MTETIEAPSEIDAKAEEVNDGPAYTAPVDDVNSADARYAAAQDAWFLELGRRVGLAAPVYQDYEDDPELGKLASE